MDYFIIYLFIYLFIEDKLVTKYFHYLEVNPGESLFCVCFFANNIEKKTNRQKI